MKNEPIFNWDEEAGIASCILSDGEKILLQNELAAVSFGGEECNILHKFLSYEG